MLSIKKESMCMNKEIQLQELIILQRLYKEAMEQRNDLLLEIAAERKPYDLEFLIMVRRLNQFETILNELLEITWNHPYWKATNTLSD